MAKASAAAEPSMEEILASIRRIISDEAPQPAKAEPPAAAKPAPKPAPAPAPEPEPMMADEGERMSEEDLDKLFAQSDDGGGSGDEEVMDLGGLEAEEPLDLVEGLDPENGDLQFLDVSSEAPAEESWDEDVAAEPPPPPPPPKPKAKAAPPPPPPPVYEEVEDDEPLISERAGASVNAAFGQLTHTILASNARTLDDIVKEMLRPMLKAWLDDNLPTIVERLVRAEIERVSRGR